MQLKGFRTLLLLLVAGMPVLAQPPKTAQPSGTETPNASKPPAAHDYRKAFLSLYQALQQQFYDSASGCYRDHEQPVPKNGYSYLWPLCGLLQAYNEAEAAGMGEASSQTPGSLGGASGPSVRRITELIDRYKSNKPPMITPLEPQDVQTRKPKGGPAPIPGYDSYLVEFGGGGRFYDDNQWLGLAWMDCWFRTKQPDFLQRGQLIYRFMLSGYDTVAGGGLYWEEGKKTTKNTCSNGPGIMLALQLYKATGQQKYLDTALLLYHWVNAHLRDETDGLYFDHIRTRDDRIGRAKFSYNTGTMLQSNVWLYELTRDPVYLQRAKAIADSAIRYFYGPGRFRDGYWFNAVLLRGYEDLLKFHYNPAYLDAIKRCVDHSLDNDLALTGVMGSSQQQLLVNQAGMLEILARLARTP